MPQVAQRSPTPIITVGVRWYTQNAAYKQLLMIADRQGRSETCFVTAHFCKHGPVEAVLFSLDWRPELRKGASGADPLTRCGGSARGSRRDGGGGHGDDQHRAGIRSSATGDGRYGASAASARALPGGGPIHGGGAGQARGNTRQTHGLMQASLRSIQIHSQVRIGS